MSSKAIFINKDFLSLKLEAYKMKQTFLDNNIDIDVVDYREYRYLKPPPYYPRHLREEWYRTHQIKTYDKAIFWLPYQRIELNNFIMFRRKLNLEKEIWYLVVEGIAKHIEGIARRIKDKYVVTPSNFSKECIEETGLKVKEVVPHQTDKKLDIDYAYGKMWRKKLPRNKKIITYIGNSVMRKGLIELYEAVKILSRKRNDFIVVLHTDNMPSMNGYDVTTLKHPNIVLQLEFGKITKAQALAKVYYSDFYIHPAKSEGFGLPVLEALQMGKPLICINAFGVNEIANKKNSFMVDGYEVSYENYPPKGFQLITFKVVKYDPKDLAGMIDIALDSPKEVIWDKIAYGYETVEKFKNTYDRFIQLLGD